MASSPKSRKESKNRQVNFCSLPRSGKALARSVVLCDYRSPCVPGGDWIEGADEFEAGSLPLWPSVARDASYNETRDNGIRTATFQTFSSASSIGMAPLVGVRAGRCCPICLLD